MEMELNEYEISIDHLETEYHTNRNRTYSVGDRVVRDSVDFF